MQQLNSKRQVRSKDKSDKFNVIDQPVIKLVFPKFPDERMNLSFVTFLFMQKMKGFNSSIQTSFCIYDIEKQETFVAQLMMRKANMDHINKTKDGFYNFFFCQTSDHIQNSASKSESLKFSIFSFFNIDLGMIKIRDFLVNKDHDKIKVQIVGIKHILFSNELLKKANYEYMAFNSFPIPSFIKRKDGQETVNGCNLRLFPFN